MSKIKKQILSTLCIIILIMQYMPSIFAVQLTKEDAIAEFQSLIIHEGGEEASGTLTDEQKFLYDENQYGYTIGSTPILKITEKNSPYEDTLYCLDAKKSFPATIGDEGLLYENCGDFTNIENQEVKSLHLSASYGDSEWEENYEALKWLFNNFYLEKQTPEQKDDFLSKAFENSTYELDVVKAYLTDDDIDIVQQYAIWYFTNRDSAEYNVTTLPAVTLSGFDEQGSSFDGLSYLDVTGSQLRQEMANYLYRYLINSALDRKEIDVIYPSIATKDLKVNIEDEYFVIGPYKINSGNVNSSEYSIKLLDQSNNEISQNNYNILIEGESNFTNKKIDEIFDTNYYIYLPKSDNKITKINLSLSYSKYESFATLWKNKTVNEEGVEVYQPTVLLTRDKKQENDNIEVEVPELIDITLQKKWDDNENQDGLRTDYEVTLTGKIEDRVVFEDSQILKSDTLSYTWKDLLKFSEGQEIIYTVDETKVPEGYIKNVNGYAITNTHVPEKTSITINKIWSDSNNQDGKRASYEVTLTGKVDGEIVYENSQILQSNEIEYTWTNLDKYKNGQEIIYTVDETKVPEGYTKNVNGYTITNTYVPEKTSITINKIWEDNNNQDGKRASYEVTLTGTADGEVVYTDTKEFNAGQITYTWTDLEKHKNGQEIIYTIDETKVPEGYTKNINGYTITNTHIPEKTSVTINKIWNDNENQDKLRAKYEVTLTGRANGQTVYTDTKEFNADQLAYTWSDLDKYKDGQEIIYTIDETKVPEGYTKEVQDYTIINTHVTEKATITISKVWKDNENQDGKRAPYEVTLTGTVDGEIVYTDTKELSPDQTTYTWRDLEKYRNNKEIIYTIDETKVPEGYTKEINGYTIINTHVPEKTSVTINKIWNDSENQDELRAPYEVTLTGTADGEVVYTDTKEFNSDQITYTWDNLDKYKNGKEIVYTVDETKVPDEYTKEVNGYTITNTHILRKFDLNLKKFITKVNNITLEESREPNVDTSPLKNETSTDANYSKISNPVEVEIGDIVTYTIRVYNEGEKSGYAEKITDYIPEGLGYLEGYKLNVENGWKLEEGDNIVKLDTLRKGTKNLTIEDFDGIDDLSDVNVIIGNAKISSSKLSSTNSDNLIKEFDRKTGEKLEYKDLEIACIVVSDELTCDNFKNIAEIVVDKDKNGKDVEDIDSIPDTVNPEDYPNTEKREDDTFQDDNDYEDLVVKHKDFDLSLQKFITNINDEKIVDREPKVEINENGKIEFISQKDPLEVCNNDLITYTIRVYNEGELSGYAKEISDNLPEGLEFVIDSEINKKYGWKLYDENGEETEDLSKAKIVKTNYLSKEVSEGREEDCLLEGFNQATKEVDYIDLQIVFKVVEDSIDKNTRIIQNIAEITDDEDKDGDDIEDIDSIPNNGEETEDDIDYEEIYVKYFDLKLQKDLVKIIIEENGEVKEIDVSSESNIPSVQVHSSLIEKTIVKFVYKITITNEGEIAGYAEEIKDYIPKGLKFVEQDNEDWKKIDENTIITNKLSENKLEPGESADVEVILEWENSENNFGVKINVAEISKDKNDSDTPDIDSTPDNKIEGEDDIDEAPVKLETIIDKTEEPQTPKTPTPVVAEAQSTPKTGDIIPIIAISVIILVIILNIGYSIYLNKKKNK